MRRTMGSRASDHHLGLDEMAVRGAQSVLRSGHHHHSHRERRRDGRRHGAVLSPGDPLPPERPSGTLSAACE
jgi:hypothetical protein